MPFHCVIRGGWWRRSSSSFFLLLFLYGAATNDAYRWSVFREYLFNERVLKVGVVNTLQLTVYSMVLAIALA